MIADRAALDSFARSASSSTVGGSELSGMSASVVTPPAAAPRVAARQPSHSSRPGSLTWTCASTTPGNTCSPRASTSSNALPWPGSTTASKRPPAMSTSASRTPSSVTTRPPRIARSAVAVLELFDEEILRALPEREAADLREILVAFDHRREVIARELPDLAREEARAVWKEDLHFGDATGVHEDLPRRGMTRVILEVDAQALLAHGDPRGLAAPAHVHELAPERQHSSDRRDGLRRLLLFPTRLERVRAGSDAEHLHRGRTIPARWRARRSPRTCSIRPTACRPPASRSRSIATVRSRRRARRAPTAAWPSWARSTSPERTVWSSTSAPTSVLASSTRSSAA